MNFLYPRPMAPEVYVLNCRRCDSEALLELGRLDGQDHTVYRCRKCGFLFSPPDGRAPEPGIEPSPLRSGSEAGRPRRARIAAMRPRPNRG